VEANMKTKPLPLPLQDKQEEQRLNTKKKIQDGIDIITEEGGVVTKKKLIAITGLSNATFSKKHAKEVLEVNKVCQFKNKKQVIKNNDNVLSDQLYFKISKLEKEKNLLNSKLQDKEIALSKFKEDYKKLKDNYNLILGKIHLIFRKIDERQIDIGIDLDDL